MSDEQLKIQRDRELIAAAQRTGFLAKLLTYTRLSGPGWLQSAITLGGGSLAGSLYLGSVGGYEMMWLQPLMMIFGVVMLSAIGYVALSTDKSPFKQMNSHVSPVLGWGWAIATLMANLVWAMPQFSLGTAAMQQNLGIVPDTPGGKWIGALILFGVCFVIVWFYDSGGWGVKLFDILLKAMVGIVVISFFAVVISMSISGEGLPWGNIIAGFVPKPSLIWEPANSIAPLIAKSSNPDFWTQQIVSAQRDRMVAAAATAVGINMTFLLPFSMLKRGWDRTFRGLATFDLATGLFLPFMLVISCVVIAAASQFHGQPDEALFGDAPRTAQTLKLEKGYYAKLDASIKATMGEDAFAPITKKQEDHDKAIKAKLQQLAKEGKTPGEIKQMLLADRNVGLGDGALDTHRAGAPREDKILAATLLQRDSDALATALEPLAGKGIAQYVFGIGVLGMAVSTIIILMLINGFTICEMVSRPSRGWLHRLGCVLPGLSGALGFLYLWSNEDANFYLAVPTSRFGMVLLPIAYIAFFFMMNNRRILGSELPRGGKRVLINILMLIAVGLALIGAAVSIFNDTKKVPRYDIEVKWIAIGVVVAMIVLGVIVEFVRKRPAEE